MTAINKQKFLAELGKLLTFMYEEDRQTALRMYGKMFEDAEDEQVLLQALGSPTRQAVAVARSYDAKVRKLQVQSQYREDAAMLTESDTMPDFVLTINRVYENAVRPADDAPEALEDQFSMFAEDGEDEPIDELFADRAPAVPVDEPLFTEEEREEALPPLDETADEPEDETGDEPADETEAFFEEFSIENDELAGTDEAAAEAEKAAETAGDDLLEEFLGEEEYYYDDEPRTRRRARVPLLILFVLLAVPLTLLGVLLLLAPTALAAGLTLSFVASGSATLMAAFGGFPVLADMLVVLGAAIVLLALGLLALWLFIWFIGGAIVGLIRGVCALGRRWCYEEVPV